MAFPLPWAPRWRGPTCLCCQSPAMAASCIAPVQELADRCAAQAFLSWRIVFNNDAYGNVRTMQIRDYDERVSSPADLLNPDFVKLGEAFRRQRLPRGHRRSEGCARLCDTASRAICRRSSKCQSARHPSLRPPARSGAHPSASPKPDSLPMSRSCSSRSRFGNAMRTLVGLRQSLPRTWSSSPACPAWAKSLLLGQLALMAQACRTPASPCCNGTLRANPSRPARTRSKTASRTRWSSARLAPGCVAALLEWESRARGSEGMLIGEAPLIGGRLMEIARPTADAAEALLRDGRTQFLIPTPSKAVRALIESSRERSIAAPQHENEAHDAPHKVLRTSWQDVYRVAVRLGLAAGGSA